MNIKMAGIDHCLAHLDLRQVFSFSKERQREIYNFLKNKTGILGSVLINTCNRTELYLSCQEGYQFHPFKLLCQFLDQDYTSWEKYFIHRKNQEAFTHLNRLACGAVSQIWGEDQIITQVKDSLDFSREEKATDSYLEVFFRNAITSGKYIKTHVPFARSEQSGATKVVEILKGQKKHGHKALIIGNGQMAQLTARTLLAENFQVTMTLRQYKYGSVPIPSGASTISYQDRYDKMAQCDVLISATASPHLTVKEDLFSKLATRPQWVFDLAVPRDIDPAIADLANINFFDIDKLGYAPIKKRQEATLKKIDEIGKKYYAEFYRWHNYRTERMLASNA